jgi:hypothetical protein
MPARGPPGTVVPPIRALARNVASFAPGRGVLPFPANDATSAAGLRNVVAATTSCAFGAPVLVQVDSTILHSASLSRCPLRRHSSSKGALCINALVPDLCGVRLAMVVPAMVASSASAKETGTERESDQLATWRRRVYSSTDVIPTCPQDYRNRQCISGNGVRGYRGI